MNKELTPMQELRKIRLENFDAIKFVRFFDENYFNLLEKEKQVIEDIAKDAFFSGCQIERQIKPREKCWQDYYNNKFKND